MAPTEPATSRADRLLDAQVAWLLARATGENLDDLIAADVEDLLSAAANRKVSDLAGATDVKQLLRLLVARVPASTMASTVADIAAEVAYDGPSDPVSLSDLVQREHVEQLLGEIFGLADVVDVVLDQVAESPLAASLAARFVTRIVADALATNRAMAEKIPGIGSLVSLGTQVTGKVAGKVVGAADKQIEGLLGDTAGKGATFAMRRLNKLIVETMKDPAARAAALQVYDMYAEEPLSRDLRSAKVASREDVHRFAGLIQDILIVGAPTEPVSALIDALVDRFFDAYGDQPVASLIEDLDLTREDVVAGAQKTLPSVLRHAVASGTAERLLRAHLAPFFASPEVAAILET
ncbi:MAG: hypothetical protein L0H31_04125 [Nocardioidaceae bacterium]|nr:hypothetical protein [Nocardioidaceae bacterium]